MGDIAEGTWISSEILFYLDKIFIIYFVIDESDDDVAI